jgi:hypothetical protein
MFLGIELRAAVDFALTIRLPFCSLTDVTDFSNLQPQTPPVYVFWNRMALYLKQAPKTLSELSLYYVDVTEGSTIPHC